MTAFQYHFTDGYGAYGADEVNIYDATVVRLREVSLGYSVPKAFLQKYAKVLGSLRLSASGRNLWFYAPNMLPGLNFDPEILSNFSDSNIQGFDLGASPSTRRFRYQPERFILTMHRSGWSTCAPVYLTTNTTL